MLLPELEKLKKYLEGKAVGVDKNKLLDELKMLDKLDIQFLYESLSLSSGVCEKCGRKL